MSVIISVHLGSSDKGRQRKDILERLAAKAGCFWNDQPSIGRWLVQIADGQMGKDYVFCPDCGEEYNRGFGPGHECDPRVLAQIEADCQADEEVCRRGDK